jgi:23S rRNA (uridine2552-2'-O)-methyltransferase
MARTKSSERWLREHFTDLYVKQARQKGYRSRAVFKLQEINARDRILKPGMTVVDLGAAPGGWSQEAAKGVGPRGRVIALDILPMEPLPGVEFMQGDFTEAETLNRLLHDLKGAPVHLVMSDMAPNISGMKVVDQPRGMYLAELALDFARRVLAPGGDLLLKLFQGAGFTAIMQELRLSFREVKVRKPKASRARSPELYVLARNFRGR